MASGKDGWVSVLQDLRARGATLSDLIVTDGDEGLLAAVQALFSATPRQRWLLHKQRKALNAVPGGYAKPSRPNCRGSGPSPPKREPSPNWPPSKPNMGSSILRRSGVSLRRRNTPSPFTSFLSPCTGIFEPPTPSKVSSVMCANAPTRLTCSRPRGVASRLSGPPSRGFDCEKFRCDRSGGDTQRKGQRTTDRESRTRCEGWFRRW